MNYAQQPYLNNNFYGNTFGPQGTGYQYNQPKPVQSKIPSTLTQEEISSLAKKDLGLNLQLTKEDVLRGICNHRSNDGLADMVIEDPNTGMCRCQICGYEFLPLDSSHTTKEDIQNYVSNVIDVMQTIKMIYIDMPIEAAREYFQIIPLLEKLPQLFEYAVKDYSRHENINGYSYNNRNMSTMNLFNMLVGSMNGAPQYQQAPQMNMGYGAPQYQQAPQYGAAPVYDPNYQTPMSNGFGYVGASNNMGYNPQTTGFQYNPNMGQPAPQYQQAPQQVAPQQTTEVATQQTAGTTPEVTQQFNA